MMILNTALSMVQTRGYINKEGRSLAPTSKGLVLTAFMQRYFRQYIDYSFTSKMEEKLDEVSGQVAWLVPAARSCRVLGGCS